ncbi:MAG: carbon-nitrogen hydrolase family protein [Pseudomonadota bacterium]
MGDHDGKRQILESLPAGGPILERCRALARRLQVFLLLGGFHESVPGDDRRCFNTSVVLDPEGEVVALYRKIHLFDVDIDDGPSLQESNHTKGGDASVACEMPFGGLGLTICYDVRFPALYEHLNSDDMVAMSVPSAFTATTGELHWHTLLRARAIENQCYIIAPAQHGAHNAQRSSYGHALIADPWGQVIAEVPAGDGYAIALVEPEVVAAARRQIPSLANRRPFT